MNFKGWLRHVFLNESVKEAELNRILDKISAGNILTDKEQSFLDLYNTLKDRDVQDYVLLSKQSVAEKIQELIDNGAIIICNMVDRNGPIGLKIVNQKMNWDSETVELTLDKGEKYLLDDKYLYNLFNKGNNKWSLEPHSEYFEKIPVKGD
jgi:hypothetical protein